MTRVYKIRFDIRLSYKKQSCSSHGRSFLRKYNIHEQRFILRDTNGFEVCKLIPPRDICCTPVSFPSCGSIKRTVVFPEEGTECGMPKEGMHQRTKYFAHRSRNVYKVSLNHLQFKDANGGNRDFRKEDKANRCRSTVAIPESRILPAAKAQDALYTCLKFLEKRMHSMHAENSLPINDSFYITRDK